VLGNKTDLADESKKNKDKEDENPEEKEEDLFGEDDEEQ
jgi:hypothetical protein